MVTPSNTVYHHNPPEYMQVLTKTLEYYYMAEDGNITDSFKMCVIEYNI